MDATESASEAAGGFRGSEAEGNVSMDIANDFDLAVERVHRTTVRQFEILGRPADDLPWRTPGMALAEQAYPVLQEAARQADNDRDLAVLVIFVRLWETSATLPPASGTS